LREILEDGSYLGGISSLDCWASWAQHAAYKERCVLVKVGYLRRWWGLNWLRTGIL